MSRDDIRAWFGDFADEPTDEQYEQLEALFATINDRFGDPDDWERRDAALSAATQVVLGDDTVEAVAAAWHAARRVEREKMAALTGALLAAGGSERDLVARTGVARMTVRKALGK